MILTKILSIDDHLKGKKYREENFEISKRIDTKLILYCKMNEWEIYINSYNLQNFIGKLISEKYLGRKRNNFCEIHSN